MNVTASEAMTLLLLCWYRNVYIYFLILNPEVFCEVRSRFFVFSFKSWTRCNLRFSFFSHNLTWLIKVAYANSWINFS